MCVWSFFVSLFSRKENDNYNGGAQQNFRERVNQAGLPSSSIRSKRKRQKKIRTQKRIQRFIYPFPDAPGRSQTQYEDDRPNDLETIKIKCRDKIEENLLKLNRYSFDFTHLCLFMPDG